MTKQKKQDIEILKKKFEQFVMELSDALVDLKTEVKSFGEPDLLPLDYSFESLDRLEKAYALVLDDMVSVEDKDTFITRVGRYLGETLRRKIGGHWDMCNDPNDVCYGLPWVTDLPGLRDFGWSPLSVAFNYRSHRRQGLLRKATEQIASTIESNRK